MSLWVSLLWLLILAIGASPGMLVAQRPSMDRFPEPVYFYEDNDAIFLGTVVRKHSPFDDVPETDFEKELEAHPEWTTMDVAIRVEDSWKGPERGETVTLVVGLSVDYPKFSVGREYLVYAKSPDEEEPVRTDRQPTYTVERRSRSKLARTDDAQQDLRFLRSLHTPDPLGGYVRGQAVGYVDWIAPFRRPGRLEARRLGLTRMRLESDQGKSYSAELDERGAFDFFQVASGEYTLTPALDNIVDPDLFSVKIHISGTNTAVDVGEVSVYAAGRIEGRVIDASGRPVSGVLVYAVKSTLPNIDALRKRGALPIFHELLGLDWTDKSGRFRLRGVPPGFYLLAVRTCSWPSGVGIAGDRFIRGQKAENGKWRFTLAAGQILDVSDIQLPIEVKPCSGASVAERPRE